MFSLLKIPRQPQPDCSCERSHSQFLGRLGGVPNGFHDVAVEPVGGFEMRTRLHEKRRSYEFNCPHSVLVLCLKQHFQFFN